MPFDYIVTGLKRYSNQKAIRLSCQSFRPQLLCRKCTNLFLITNNFFTTFEKRKIMKITLLKKYINHNVGETIDVSDERGQYLIAVKSAVKSDNSVNNIVVTGPKVIEPKKRGRKSSKK